MRIERLFAVQVLVVCSSAILERRRSSWIVRFDSTGCRAFHRHFPAPNKRGSSQPSTPALPHAERPSLRPTTLSAAPSDDALRTGDRSEASVFRPLRLYSSFFEREPADADQDHQQTHQRREDCDRLIELADGRSQGDHIRVGPAKLTTSATPRRIQVFCVESGIDNSGKRSGFPVSTMACIRR